MTQPAFHEWSEGCETAGDYTCAGFDGTPYGDVDGIIEEVVGLDQTVDVTEADSGTDAAADYVSKDRSEVIWKETHRAARHKTKPTENLDFWSIFAYQRMGIGSNRKTKSVKVLKAAVK